MVLFAEKLSRVRLRNPLPCGKILSHCVSGYHTETASQARDEGSTPFARLLQVLIQSEITEGGIRIMTPVRHGLANSLAISMSDQETL